MSNQPLGSLDQQLASYQKTYLHVSPRRLDEARYGPVWTRFAAAAGASLAAAANADAAIQHIVPVSPIRVDIFGTNFTYIDLDGVGGNDLLLAVGTTNPYPYFDYRLIGLAYGLGGAALIGDSSLSALSYNYAAHRFNYGETIPAATPTFPGAMLQQSVTSFSATFTYRGQFGRSGTGYAGFVNNLGGTPQAGWIKIRTEPFNFGGVQRLLAVSVLEWAYEDVPGKSIMAGQTMSVGGPDGDYNDDGVVDAADYTVWRDKLGTSEPLPNDPHGGTIDQDQYDTWVNNFGATGGAGSGAQSAAGAIPEPSTISLGVLALGAAGVAALRRRSKGNARD